MKRKEKPIEYAVRLLAGRRRHSVEIRNKMLSKDYGTDETEAAIKRLIDLKYLDDGEFINLYIGDRLKNKPQSIRLLRQKLLQKGIPAHEIDAATGKMENMEQSELLNAEKAGLKKLKTLRENDKNKQKQKLTAFLAARGFSHGTALATVKKLLSSDLY